MRTYSLPICAALFAGSLAAPVPAQAGPTTCPTTAAICIDESIEGSGPTVIFSDVPNGTSSTILRQHPAVGEEWIFTISVPFSFDGGGIVQISSLSLLEPSSHTLSDAITDVSTRIQGLNDIDIPILIMTFNLFSDNDLGQIGVTGPFINNLTEDGTFQQVPNTFFVTNVDLESTPINVYFRSDAEVPEPASLVLFGTALLGFGVMRRRRAWRPRKL